MSFPSVEMSDTGRAKFYVRPADGVAHNIAVSRDQTRQRRENLLVLEPVIANVHTLTEIYV